MAKARTAEKLLTQLHGAEAANRRHTAERKRLEEENAALKAEIGRLNIEAAIARNSPA